MLLFDAPVKNAWEIKNAWNQQAAGARARRCLLLCRTEIAAENNGVREGCRERGATLNNTKIYVSEKSKPIIAMGSVYI